MSWVHIDTVKKGRELAVSKAVKEERERIIIRIQDQICFDAKADPDGRCTHHKGKCYELGLLVVELRMRGN